MTPVDVKQDGRGDDPFTFVDLFAGIGGFHAALTALGGECVYASEIDPAAATVYERNWKTPALGDIVEATTERMDVPEHDVLVAGFPCQPFSKSGFQRGMDEARGTLFWNVLRVLEVRRPAVVLLENVRNLAGPRHAHEWEVIIRSLRQLGYRVSETPAVFSPHLLPPERGGRPQVRERVFIAATRVDEGDSMVDVPPVVSNKPLGDWNKHRWDLSQHLPAAVEVPDDARYVLTSAEVRWLTIWDDFIQSLRAAGEVRLPGFPIWRDAFQPVAVAKRYIATNAVPSWKANFLLKNAELYERHEEVIDAWLRRSQGLADFPPSRRKLEWQAQDAASLFDTVLHFRPSGIRAKKPTYLPALVAITQTSILGAQRRRITPVEAAYLQGLPVGFDFGDQRESQTYKQLGNGVNVGVVFHVLREQVIRDREVLLNTCQRLLKAVSAAPLSPDPQSATGEEHEVDMVLLDEAAVA